MRDDALPCEIFEEKGRDLPEGIEASKLLVAYGYDALDVDVGSYDSWWWSHPPMYQDKGLYIPYAKIIKANQNYEWCLYDGKIDLKALMNSVISPMLDGLKDQ